MSFLWTNLADMPAITKNCSVTTKALLVAPPPPKMVDDVLGLQNCVAKSRKLNIVVNTFVELEKLNLSQTKCHKLHMGSNENNCPDMLVHGEGVKNYKRENYLGDILSSN